MKGRKCLTSFGISQIVNKDCLPRAEAIITDLDTETKDDGMSDGGGRSTWSDGGRGRGERRGKACCANTAAGGTGTKTHLNSSEGAVAATREPVTFVGSKWIYPETDR
jgi:hypothetical protein